MTEYRQPIFGADGEPCPTCGAPLSGDQRYCLACGARRGEARLPFQDILREQATTTTELVPLGTVIPAAGGGYGFAPPPPGDLNERLRRNSPLMGLVGILLLALLIGVLLGHWAGDDQPVAQAQPRTQVLQLSGAAAPAAAVAPTTTTAAATPTPTPDATATTATTDTTASTTPDNVTAPPKDAAASALENCSGAECAKAADKAPKNISTGGKAPPKDNKPAAGGGDFEDIG